jgi:NAD(P)-dependent dehydrogenase (short-subunit alcohol dehydrogenase family)
MTGTTSFHDRIVLITGAGGGIGREAALQFARAGASLALSDRDPALLEETRRQVADLGGRVSARLVDVTDGEAVRDLIAATVAEFGRLDVAFNNAGIEEEDTPLASGDEALFDRIMAVNVKGVWLCLKHQLAVMTAQGHGSIVNTASVAGLVGAPRRAAYAASKHAVVGLTRSAAAETGRKGVRVNAVCPGPIRTAMLERAMERMSERAGKPAMDPGVFAPMGRVGEAAEVAAAVLWLASDAAAYVTGHTLTVDGGLTVI